MTRYIFISLLLLLPIFSWAQKKCRPLRHPEAIKLAERGKKYVSSYPEKALRDLSASLRFEGTNADVHYLIAKLYEDQYFLKKKQEYTSAELVKLKRSVEKHYNLAIKFCPSFKDFDSYFRLGQFYYNLEDRTKAKSYLGNFIKNSNSELLDSAKWFAQSIDTYFYLTNHPVEFHPKKIAAVSTHDNDEYLPLVSPDGQYLFFTRRSKRKVRAGNVMLDEVFMYSHRANATNFGNGKYMPLPFNDGRNQGGATVTIDNKTMFVTICTNVFYGSSAYKNCDIYETYMRNGKWTRPRPLGENVNGRHSFEAQPTVTADGNTLYFVSIRKGGLGKMDIYRTTRNKYGEWTKAENLGPTINTTQDDKTPYIHTDGHTLYFASKGHFGVGGFDIFYSRFKGGKWQKPQNLGYPINTEEDNLGLILSSDGGHIYFASRHLSNDKQYDIFSAKLYEQARPEKILFLRGSIDDTNGNDLPGASVNLENIQTQDVTHGMVDKKTGEYAVAVPVDKNSEYMITVEKDDYIFRSQYIDPRKPKFDSVNVIDFDVPKIKRGITVQLENIYFEFDSDKFNYKSRVSLNNFLKFLKKNATLKVKIMGHTDNVGSHNYNIQLSTKRAKAVEKYLIKNGIKASRLSSKGFGETKPVGTNETDDGRAKNRRTEFEIY